MKRREFLKRTAPLAAAPVLLNGLSLRALAGPVGPESSFLNTATDRVLVVIQLEGGNDGLNTVIPVDDDAYYRQRPVLGIAKAAALPLEGQPLLALHPAMEGMQRMFNEERLAIVQNVGYDHTNMSHFAGTEIWHTGSGARKEEYLRTGWIGRYLRREFPAYPEELPGDPPAIEISPATSSMFTIVGSSISMSLTDPAEFYELVQGVPNGSGDDVPDTPAGREKHFIDIIDRQSHSYAEAIRAAAAKANNLVHYPAENRLAESLAIIARLIAGGLATRVYKVGLAGFDTHFNQQVVHEHLLGTLSGAVKAFQDDLEALGVADRVVGMTYSEFGRRAYDNGGGTDHGAAAPHLVFGKMVHGGRVLGGLPDLENLDGTGSLKHTFDFHCYYASVIGPLFGLEEGAMGEILPLGRCASPDYIPLYRSTISSAGRNRDREGQGIAIYPVPAASVARVVITSPAGDTVRISITDAVGRTVYTSAAVHIPAGRTTVPLNVSMFASGTYFVTAEGSKARSAAHMVIAR